MAAEYLGNGSQVVWTTFFSFWSTNLHFNREEINVDILHNMSFVLHKRNQVAQVWNETK